MQWPVGSSVVGSGDRIIDKFSGVNERESMRGSQV